MKLETTHPLSEPEAVAPSGQIIAACIISPYILSRYHNMFTTTKEGTIAQAFWIHSCEETQTSCRSTSTH